MPKDTSFLGNKKVRDAEYSDFLQQLKEGGQLLTHLLYKYNYLFSSSLSTFCKLPVSGSMRTFTVDFLLNKSLSKVSVLPN